MIIGLTGGIGSGKSTVSGILRELGCTIVDADLLSREITEKGSPVLLQLAEVFGQDILFPDGSLNRKLLASRAFASGEATEKLCGITHPAIKELAETRLKNAQLLHPEMPVIYDAPILIESGQQAMADRIWVVCADAKTRAERVSARDGRTRAEVEAIMSRQLSDEERAAFASEIIDNNGTIEELRRRLTALVENVKKASAQGNCSC